VADVQRWPCTEDAYHADGRLSRSWPEIFIESARLYAGRRGLVAPAIPEPTPTAALRWGSLVHLRVLEPYEFRRRVYVKPPDLNRRSNAGKAELDRRDAEGMLAVSIEEEQRLEAIGAAVLAHPLAGRMLESSEREVAFTWRDDATGIDCRARVDMLRLRGRGAVIVDLKTTDDPSPFEFGRSAARYGYHRQAAFYSRPIRELVGTAPMFCFVAVRSTPPHEVVVYRIDAADIAAADRQVDRAMRQLAACIETNTWAAPWESPTAQTLELPRWALEENA
jgi:hypothetical protein